jgi:hypothetical protein
MERQLSTTGALKTRKGTLFKNKNHPPGLTPRLIY